MNEWVNESVEVCVRKARDVGSGLRLIIRDRFVSGSDQQEASSERWGAVHRA
jgi:hypothetical protein